MSERLPSRTTVLSKAVVIVDDQGEKRLFLLKCSRRQLGRMLEAALQARNVAAT
jgi:hypothetical protein